MSIRAIKGLLFGICLAMSGSVVAQPPTPHEVEDFIREERFDEVTMSQKGTHIAVTVPEGDRTVLYIFKTGESRPLTRVHVGYRNGHIVDVVWVSDHRLIYSTAVKNQLDEAPVPTGDTWAIDADGSKRRQLPHAVKIVDTLETDDNNVLATWSFEGSRSAVLATWSSGSPKSSVLFRLDVYEAVGQVVAEVPIPSAWFSVDLRGEPRFSWNIDEKDSVNLYFLAPGKSEWKLINERSVSGKTIHPVGYSADGSVAYLLSEETTGPHSVLAFDIATATTRPVSRDALADPFDMIRAIGKREIIGVSYVRSTPRYEYFDPDSPDARAHRALTAAFPGQIVFTSDNTTARNEALVYVYGDREPGGYYAMNLDSRKVSPMMFRADWIDSRRLSTMREIVLEARDGRRIPAFLTIPVGSDGKNLPMVVHPHGGPITIKDSWGYNPTVQMLASHGYAVLQVNFRGSSGYGREHMEAGYKQWGLRMQDDLTDATRWAIEQGIADKQRICIFGASYGGYAALMGAAKEPELYRCAAGQVGVYDLPKIWADDSKVSEKVRRFLERTLNHSDGSHVSPNRIANRIRIPVFLSAGHEDEIAPVEHTRMMEAALKKAGVPVETLYFKNEGHGVYDLENKRRFSGQLLNFLHRHIGGRAPVLTTPEKK